MNTVQASKRYEVSRMSIYRYKKSNGRVCGRPGPATDVTENEENLLAERVVMAAKLGWGVTRKELLQKLKVICASRKTSF